MAAPARQLHLNAFLRNIAQHEAAWRLPETQLSGITDIDHYIELSHIAERGKLDAIFFAERRIRGVAGPQRIRTWRWCSRIPGSFPGRACSTT